MDEILFELIDGAGYDIEEFEIGWAAGSNYAGANDNMKNLALQ